jgi:hypothetical protein
VGHSTHQGSTNLDTAFFRPVSRWQVTAGWPTAITACTFSSVVFSADPLPAATSLSNCTGLR